MANNKILRNDELQIRVSNSDPNLLSLHNISNGSGAGISMTDHGSETQIGRIRYYHSDGVSQGGGASFHITSTEQDTVLVLGTNTETARIAVKSANSNSEVDYGFYGDTNTGMYAPSSSGGQVGLVSDGSRKLLVSSNGVHIQNGNFSIPDHAIYAGNYIYHDGDTDTFMHFDSDKIRFDAGGQHLLQIREGFAGRHTGVHSPNSITAQNLAGANMIKKGTDIAVSTGQREEVSFFDGTKVQAHISTGSGNTAQCYHWYSSENVPVDPEKDYEFSVWVKSPGDHNLYVGWHEYNSSGTQISSNPYFRTGVTDTSSQTINNINGWTHFKFKLKSHRTTSAQADSAGTDRYADNDSQIIQNTGSNTDGVMHSTCAFVHIRMGTCYGNTNTTKTYFYNPMITEAVYAEATQQLWTSIANIEKSATIGDAPVTPNSNFNELVISSSSHTGISIFSGGTSNHGAIYFGDAGANNVGQFKYLHDTNAFTLATNGNAASLTLDNNRNATFGSGLYIPSYIYHESDTNTYFGFSANDTFQVNTGGSERMRVTSAGKVGIGTDTPGMMLHIKGGDEATMKLESTSGEPAIFWAPGGSSLKWENRASASRWQLYQYDESEWVFNIYDAKVGIGTVSPEKKLHVITSTTDATPQVLVQNSSTGDASLQFNVSGASYTLGIDNSDSDKFKISTTGLGTNDRLTIDSSGNSTFGGKITLPSNKAVEWPGGSIRAESNTLKLVATTLIDLQDNTQIQGNLTVTGDLNITGDINSTSVTDLDITDKTITIAKGAADSSAADGAGIVVDGASASLLYDHSGTQWEFNKNVETDGNLLPKSDAANTLGGSSKRWNFAYINNALSVTDGNINSNNIFDFNQGGTFNGPITSETGILNLDDNGDADGVINAKASLTLNIDADNNSTGELFRVQSNTTSANNNPLFKIDEDGDVTIQGVGADTRLVIDDGATGQAITLQSSGSGEGFIKFTDAQINRSGGDLNMWTNNLDIEFSTDNGSTNLLRLDTSDIATFNTTQGSGAVSLKMTPTFQRMKLHYNGSNSGVDFLGYDSGTLWLITNNTTNNLVMGSSWDWDRQVTWRYTPGTSGASAGVMKIGQFDKNHTNYTHGQTEFYTGNGTSNNLVLRLDTNKLSTFLGTVKIDGVSNYTGIEVKGAGASRPAINFTNVNQGNLGRIYGTEGNALVLASGSSNATALTLASNQTATFEQNVSLKPTKKLYLDGGSSTYIYESSDGVIDFIGDGVDLVSMKQNGTQSEVVVNESSGDVDFRVESNNSTHAFFVEAAGTGKVGIGTASPVSYNSRGRDLVIKKTGQDVGISIVAEASGGTDYSSSVMFADGTGGTAGYRGIIEYDHANDSMAFSTATSPCLTLNANQTANFHNSVYFSSASVGVISWGSMGGGTGFGIRGESGRGLSLGSNGAWDKMIINTSGNTTFAGTVAHQGLEPTTGTSIDQIKEFNMSTQLSANTWTDSGIDGGDLSTGTWAMQVLVSDYNLGGSHYSEYYSAILSWYASGTNETTHAVDEIPCHRAGHAPNDGDVQFRTTRGSSANLKLQVKHNEAYSAAPDQSGGKEFKFKFRRLM